MQNTFLKYTLIGLVIALILGGGAFYIGKSYFKSSNEAITESLSSKFQCDELEKPKKGESGNEYEESEFDKLTDLKSDSIDYSKENCIHLEYVIKYIDSGCVLRMSHSPSYSRNYVSKEQIVQDSNMSSFDIKDVKLIKAEVIEGADADFYCKKGSDQEYP